MELQYEDIAEIAHEARRAYCNIGLAEEVVSWNGLPLAEQQDVIELLKFCVENAGQQLNPEALHTHWMGMKLRQGWKYGELTDAEHKEHALLLPYSELSEENRLKMALFLHVSGLMINLCPQARKHIERLQQATAPRRPMPMPVRR